MREFLLIRFFALALFGIAPLCAATPSAIDVNICDLFTDLAKWDGQMVRFEATIDKGSFEDAPFIDGWDCPARIRIGNVAFPNALVLAKTQGDRRQRIHDVEFQTEPSYEAWRLLSQIDEKTEFFRAVVIGLFETRTPLSRLVTFNKVWPDGLAYGFGHLNAAPAQVILKSLSDFRIEKKRSPVSTTPK